MKSETEEYYIEDVDLKNILSSNSAVDDMLYMKDLNQRKLFIDENICQDTVRDAIRHIMQFNKDDKGKKYEDRDPIILYVSSYGGDDDPGFALVNVITASKTPVYTVNIGYWYSMGFLIGIAGHKRFAMPNARFLHHDGINSIQSSFSKAQDRMDFCKRVEERIKSYVLSRSKLTDKEYDDKFRSEWYMFADEAKDRGFVDYIIGEDCDIDEIV